MIFPGAAKFHLHNRHANVKMCFPRTTFYVALGELIFIAHIVVRGCNSFPISIEFNKKNSM